MTVTYSLDVSKTRFCGFTKLLARWKGSIYKILWKEFLVFCVGYATVSIIYRSALNTKQRELFEKLVLFVESAIDFIPLSFVLGFYVSLVIGRWWAQYEAIPWPDRLCLMIASFVHGADERSRMIRRTLARYLILLQALAFQLVSTSVKRRFPTTQHLVAAGIMTKEEQSVYDKISFVYGKWWLPCQWFSSLLMRAKKEGRIKDPILLEGIFRELLNYRNACGTMLGYDWISVPLVYTQVVTLATYIYAAALIVGRQYLDTSKGYNGHEVDLYIPIFTIMQFFFYVGWLKVAEQIVNPYGDDDDDFELNWCLDRTVHVAYLIVDHLQTKHPKIRKDFFWDEIEPRLPQTKHSAKASENTQLGSAFNLEVEEAKYLPMDSFLEQDEEANMYISDSVAQRNSMTGFRSSFIMKLFNSGYGQSFRRKSVPKWDAKSSVRSQGYDNPSFVPNQDKSAFSTPAISRKSSLMSFMKKASPSQSRTSSISFHPNSAKLRRHKNHEMQEGDKTQQPNVLIPDFDSYVTCDAGLQTQVPVTQQLDEFFSGNEHSDPDNEAGGQRQENLMPPIPEEPSKTTSLTSPEPSVDDELETSAQKTEPTMPSIPEESPRTASLVSVEPTSVQVQDASSELEDVQTLLKEANEVLKELNRTISHQGHREDCELKGYESCCSITSDASSDESCNESRDESSQKGNDTIIDIDGDTQRQA